MKRFTFSTLYTNKCIYIYFVSKIQIVLWFKQIVLMNTVFMLNKFKKNRDIILFFLLMKVIKWSYGYTRWWKLVYLFVKIVMT